MLSQIVSMLNYGSGGEMFIWLKFERILGGKQREKKVKNTRCYQPKLILLSILVDISKELMK